MQLAETLKSPIVHAMRGKEHVEWNNPYDVGMTGLIGFSSGYHAMENCEALLMLGTDFPYRQFYPRNAKIAQIDVRAEAIGRRVPVELGVVGQVGPTLRALLPRLTSKTDRRFLDGALRHYAEARKGSTNSPRAAGAARCTRSTSPASRANSPATTRSSPAMSACRRCGRRATSR